MNDTDFHTLTGAYAANALPLDEQIAFDHHLQQCHSCAQEVSELVATAARLGSAAGEPAPHGLRERVLAEIQNTRQLSPLAGAAAPQHTRLSRGGRTWLTQPLAVAASLVAVVAVGMGVVAVDAQRRADRAEQITSILADPGAITATGTSVRGGQAKVVAAGGNAVFSAQSLPRLRADRDYQLWVIGEGGERSARSAGVLAQGSGGVVQHFIPGVDPGEKIGMTIERRGGAPSPSGPLVLVMAVSA